MSEAESTVTSEVGPWAMVPAWILDVTDKRGKGLNGSELRVYIALRSFADQHGRAFPFVHTIATRAGVEPRTAERAIAQMREMKILTTTRRFRDDGSIARCDYKLRDTPPDEMVGRVPADQSGGSRRDDRSKNTPGEHTKETHHELSGPRARSARSGANEESSDGGLSGTGDQIERRTTSADIDEWRADDLELFKTMTGEALTSNGQRWQEGQFTAEAFYRSFRRLKQPIRWPGRFMESLHDVDDWLLDQGLERVE